MGQRAEPRETNKPECSNPYSHWHNPSTMSTGCPSEKYQHQQNGRVVRLISFFLFGPRNSNMQIPANDERSTRMQILSSEETPTASSLLVLLVHIAPVQLRALAHDLLPFHKRIHRTNMAQRGNRQNKENSSKI
jgi:hypothetical protein